ncbi:unnamed protein product [Urochloa humidicola]
MMTDPECVHPIPMMTDPQGHVMPPDAPNGSKSVAFFLRLFTLGLALASAIVMATASKCTIDGGDDGSGDITTVTFTDFPPFVYLVACNITATILEAAAVYLQYRKDHPADEEQPPVLPGVLLVIVDVTVQVLLYSSAGGAFAAVAAYGDQISACTSADGNFRAQVGTAKLLGFGAGLAAALAAIIKDVALPFNVCPCMS